jgi:hypothetical protein
MSAIPSPVTWPATTGGYHELRRHRDDATFVYASSVVGPKDVLVAMAGGPVGTAIVFILVVEQLRRPTGYRIDCAIVVWGALDATRDTDHA